MGKDNFEHTPIRRTFDENKWVSGLTIDLESTKKKSRRAFVGDLIQRAAEIFTAAGAIETIRGDRDLRKIRNETSKSKPERSPLLYTGYPPIALFLNPITVDLSTDNSTLDTSSLFDSSSEVIINDKSFNQLSSFQVINAPVVDYKDGSETRRAIKFILQKPAEGITKPFYVFYPDLTKVLPIKKIINNDVYVNGGPFDSKIGDILDENEIPTLQAMPVAK